MTTRLGYHPALDGIRAISILAVMLYHSGLIHGGFLGVDVFFTLSGFLITTLLIEEHAAAGRIALRDFYCRRALRLLPALVPVVIVSGVAMIATAGPDRVVGMSLFVLAVIFYVANWAAILGKPRDGRPVRHVEDDGEDEERHADDAVGTRGGDHGHPGDDHHGHEGGEKPKGPPAVEVAQGDAPGGRMLFDQERGNEKAAQGEEDVHAEEAAVDQPGVIEHDGENGDCPDTVESRVVAEPCRHGRRFGTVADGGWQDNDLHLAWPSGAAERIGR